MKQATEIFEKHWTKRTGKPLDEATKQHMAYCIEAINEALLLGGIVRPEVEGAKEGEPLPESVVQNGRVRCSCMNQEVGQEWCDKLCVDAGEHD